MYLQISLKYNRYLKFWIVCTRNLVWAGVHSEYIVLVGVHYVSIVLVGVHYECIVLAGVHYVFKISVGVHEKYIVLNDVPNLFGWCALLTVSSFPRSWYFWRNFERNHFFFIFFFFFFFFFFFLFSLIFFNWLVGCILRHINPGRLFKTKSSLYIHIKYK